MTCKEIAETAPGGLPAAPAPEPTASRLVGAIMQRVEQGQSIAEMERAFELAERMMMLERDQEVNKAMAIVQEAATARPVPHDAEYDGKFTYSSLEAIVGHVEGAVKRAGFSYSTTQEVAADGKAWLVLTLRHACGGRHETRVPMVVGRSNQMATEQMTAMGGITNAARRAWIQALGLVTSSKEYEPTVAGAPPITADQVAELDGILDHLGSHDEKARAKFMRWAGVTHLDELRATRYREAVDFLRQAIDRAEERASK